jgi:hypothetical protein
MAIQRSAKRNGVLAILLSGEPENAINNIPYFRCISRRNMGIYAQ